MISGLAEGELGWHRKVAIELFNHTWNLLEKPDRTPEEDDRMIHSAHASRLHWSIAGNALNLVIGEWQISRVYSMLQRSEPAIYHARRCLTLSKTAVVPDFFQAEAHEAMARALTLMGDTSAARQHVADARAIGGRISDPADKQTLENDLASIPLDGPA